MFNDTLNKQWIRLVKSVIILMNIDWFIPTRIRYVDLGETGDQIVA